MDLSIQKINVETNIIAILKYNDMSSVNLTLNMKSKNNLRISQIILESAIITIDHNLNKIIILNNKKKIIKQFNDDIGISYIRELKYLIKLISNNIKSSLIFKNIEQTNSSLIAMHSSLKRSKIIFNKMKNTTAFIFARSGSKGLKDKNIKDFAGKPLIAHTITAALESKIFNDVVVSTNSKRIAAISESYGASVPFKDPKNMQQIILMRYLVGNTVLRIIEKILIVLYHCLVHVLLETIKSLKK